ncbi:MAG: hypothetical protein H0U92_03285 [Actinobacteria bacterium]|nr:hypothetical protein [Actinomycetota bacterium]
MATPDELAHWYADAWNETDPAKRRALLEAACSPGIRFLQEGFEYEVVGIDALDRTIAEYQATWPDGIEGRVEITTPIQSHHGIGRGGFAWIVGDERTYGTDFAEIGDDGRMQMIAVFIDAPT